MSSINNPPVLSETIALTDLSDVVITSASDHQTLYYDTGTGEWKNNSTLKIDVDNSAVVKAGKKLILDGG